MTIEFEIDWHMPTHKEFNCIKVSLINEKFKKNANLANIIKKEMRSKKKII